MKALNNRVRAMREAKSLTQAELAQLTGVSRQAINAIETGKYDPSIRLAYALSRVFGCAIEDIFIFEEGGLHDEKK
ncbi:MAG: anaerobic benzoate catabolism transcriptional regulator [Firmicutes bacterium ADurb.Bin182]|nr:MAG: anaerobic benzoate catabolism transcriptional regulator [Firmicutes bacterium ADurb.Bin182]